MTTDARKQLLSQLHLTSKYFEHLLTAAKSAPITDGELTVAQDSDPISDQFGLMMCWVRIMKGKFTMKMRDVRSVLGLDEGYASITEAGDSVLCTGGFWRFDGDVRRPEGLIVSDGVVRSPLAFGGQGGIVFSGGFPFELAPTSSALMTGVREAVQSKPLLIATVVSISAVTIVGARIG